MNSTALIIIGILALLAVIALRELSSRQSRMRPSKTSKTRRHRATRGPARSKATEHSADSYHALSVVGTCQAARDIAGKRFLVREAPKLPLAGCDASSCQCKFAHHDDRRIEAYDRRDQRNTLRSELYVAEGQHERRVSHGRRASDYSYDSYRGSANSAGRGGPTPA